MSRRPVSQEVQAEAPIKNIAPQDQHLVQLLFEANHQINGWDTFLTAFADHFQLRSCHLYAYNPTTMDIRFQEWAGSPPNEHFYQLYVEEYIHLDPLQAALHQWPMQTFYSTSLHSPINEIENSKFFKGWCDPQDILAGSACAFIREDQCILAINHTRSHSVGHYTTEEIERLDALAPLIKKALDLRLMIADCAKDSNRLQQAVNQLPFAAALFNEFGEAVMINEQMRTHFFDQDRFSLGANRQVCFGSSEVTRDIYVNITESICQAKGTSLVYAPQDVIFEKGDTQFNLQAQALTEHNEEQQQTFIGAIVYAIDLNNQYEIDPLKLNKLFNFTNSEARCCQLLAKGMAVKHIAQTLEKSVETVTEQLTSCYRKSGVRGQVELVSLVRALPG